MLRAIVCVIHTTLYLQQFSRYFYRLSFKVCTETYNYYVTKIFSFFFPITLSKYKFDIRAALKRVVVCYHFYGSAI